MGFRGGGGGGGACLGLDTEVYVHAGTYTSKHTAHDAHTQAHHTHTLKHTTHDALQHTSATSKKQGNVLEVILGYATGDMRQPLREGRTREDTRDLAAQVCVCSGGGGE
jgi:hypothetical protein